MGDITGIRAGPDGMSIGRARGTGSRPNLVETDGYGNPVEPKGEGVAEEDTPGIEASQEAGPAAAPEADAGAASGLTSEDYALVQSNKGRDWRRRRANADEMKDYVRIAEYLVRRGHRYPEVMEALGMSYATYNSWKKATSGVKETPGQGQEATDETAPRVETTRSKYMAEIDLAPVVRENREVVIQLLTIGKPEAIKNAIRSLIEAH
jgi:transposase